MKIITFFVASLQGGGAERMMVNLVNEFSKRNYHVHLLLLSLEGPYLSEVNSKVKIVNLNSKNVRKSIFLIRNYLKRYKPSIVLSTQIHINISLIFANFLLLNRTSIVLREPIAPISQLKNLSNFWQKFIFFIAKKIYPFADAFVAVSEDARKEMINYYGIDNKIVATIYNPVYSDEIIKKSFAPIKHKWLNGKFKIICAMGRVSPQKDFATLIRAFSILIKNENELRLIILGDSSNNKEYFFNLLSLCKELNVSDKVDFVGFQSNPFPYLRKTDVFVLSSKYEGLPSALIQAMALECQIVSTNCKSGPREILEDGKYGKLVNVEDHIAMAKAISEIIVKPFDIKLVSNRAKFFNHMNAIEQYSNLINNYL